MIIVDRFVFIHMPKTGGTFVTEVLKHLHGRSSNLMRQLGVDMEVPAGKYGPILDLQPKHGTCADIPFRHRGKPILSTIRNPFDWYVSQYEFAWWKRTSEYYPERYPTPAGFAISTALPEFQQRYGHFPDLTFADFMELCLQAADVYNKPMGTDIGLYSHGFLRYYCRNAERQIVRLARLWKRTGTVNARMFGIDFLDTSQINRALHAYLLSAGYEANDLEFILGLGRILPGGRGRGEGQHWQAYYDERLLALVSEKDGIGLELYREPALRDRRKEPSTLH